jgi:hypothetical protein
MLQDVNTIFSGAIASDGTRTGQAITATAISTNVLDLRSGRTTPVTADESVSGPELYLLVVVTQAFNNLTTLTITLESDSAATLASAPVVHASQAVALAGLTLGATVVRIQLPSADYKRYLGVRYTVAGTAPTTGAVQTFLTMDQQRNLIYPGNFSVDV